MPEPWKKPAIQRLPKDITNFSYNCQDKTGLLQLKKIILKEKCNKSLIKKLKKYKLRKDGIEDPDVIDISKQFRSLLRIRSPDHEYSLESKIECEEIKIKNYLSKMEKKYSNSKITKQHLNQNNTLQNVTLNNSCVIEQDKFSLSNTHENILESIDYEDCVNNKQVNAFHLLMNSHNKSIGSNSSGRAKSGDEFDSEEVISKRTLKIKRNSVLQKMAEAKGYLKHVKNEELKDEFIREKMAKRKERLKKILTIKKEINLDCNMEKSLQIKKKDKTNTLLACIEKTDKKVKIACKGQPQIENISKEDEDFLKKLSPSIKKTENVLCYFKKVDKKQSSVENNVNDLGNGEINSLIKVKLISKSKHKSKKKKKFARINNNTEDKEEAHSVLQTIRTPNLTKSDVSEKIILTSEQKVMDSVNKSCNKNLIQASKKRKRKLIVEKDSQLDSKVHSSLTNTVAAQSRPKRCINKPAKYVDRLEVSSSEDELLIFTPKKKKQSLRNTSRNLTEVKGVNKNEETLKDYRKTTIKKTVNKKNDKKKTCTAKKLAPIFTKAQKDPAAIEAKQKFLQSGMPDQIKKIVLKQNNIQVGIDNFPVTKHVKQNEFKQNYGIEKLELIPLTLEDYVPDETEFNFTSLLNLNNTTNICFSTLFSNNVQKCLKHIKDAYTRFPVYRTYHTLKNKCFSCNENHTDNDYLDHSCEIFNNVTSEKMENLNTLNWSEKYRSSAAKDIIGNFDSIKELKKWLTIWKENDMAAKIMVNNDSDISDFYNSDTDSRDSLRLNNNLIIITGPVGSGKTSCVYAVASELAMKVIEVNASSRRTGKIMLQDLQEATQSHKVDRTKGTNSDNSQNSQEIVLGGSKKQKIKTKTSQSSLLKKKSVQPENAENLSQSCNRTEMSVILIDDADIVFDQDDGFASALSQIVQCSKRPVIIVTTTLSSPHLQRYLLCGHILKMNRLMPRMLGTWLDILCLVDSGQCAPGLGAKLLEYFRGDMRKSINALQFLISSQSSLKNCVNVTEGSILEDNIEDESSNLSWANVDDNTYQSQTVNTLDSLSSLFSSDISSLDSIQSSPTITNLSAWWNLLLPSNANCNHMPFSNQNGMYDNQTAELTAVTSAIDSISLSDTLTHRMKPNTKNHITSYPWFTLECDSVSEKDNVESYSRSLELGYEICTEFVQNSVDQAQKIISRRMSPSAVSEMILEREKEKIVQRHHALTNSFNMSTALDRRALAIDYWTACRTICRLEKDKIDSNIKRKNRYCHYLKTLKVTCNNDSYYKLCESLCPKCDTKKT